VAPSILAVPTTAVPNNGGSAALCLAATVPALPIDRGAAVLCPATGTASAAILCMFCETTEPFTTKKIKKHTNLVKSETHLTTVRRCMRCLVSSIVTDAIEV
jgi:hypothetical protein